jgi:hypothetical protein
MSTRRPVVAGNVVTQVGHHGERFVRDDLLAQEADAAVEYFEMPASGAIVEVLIV